MRFNAGHRVVQARRKLALPLALVLTGMLATGCAATSSGSKSSSSSSSASAASSGSSGSSGSGGSSGVATAKAAVTKAQAPISSLTPAGPAFSALKATRGKTVGIVAAMASDPGYVAEENSFASAAKVLGMSVKVCDGNDYNTADEARCVEQFTSQKVNVIILDAVAPSTVTQPLAAAVKSGIKTIAINTTVEGAPLQANVDGQVSFPYVTGAKLLAQGVIALSNGDANVEVINSSDYTTSPPMIKAMKATFASECPKCTVTYPNVPIADWSTQLTPLAQTSVQKDPQLSYIIPLYDTEIPLVNAGLSAAGASSKVKVLSLPGSIGIVPFIAKSGNPTAMDISASVVQQGWAWADDAARLLAGQSKTKALKNAQIAVRIFDDSNIKSINLKDPTDWLGSFNIEAFYKKQWGVS